MAPASRQPPPRGSGLLVNHKFGYLLASLVLLLLVFPFLERSDVGRHSFMIVLAFVVISAIRALGGTHGRKLAALGLGLLALGLNLARFFSESQWLLIASHVSIVVFFGFSIVLLFSHLLAAHNVTHDEVLGAISIYFLLAIAFASLYLLADRIEPNSFARTIPTERPTMTYSDYLYYSFGTITTSGSGDIVETGAFVRTLSLLESVTGVFFVAFLVSKLVSDFRKR